MLGVAVVAVLLWKRPHTPAVLDDTGREIPYAVASLERIELGGVARWILVRGRAEKPIVLIEADSSAMPASE